MTDSLTSLEQLAPLRWLFLDLNSYFASVEQQDNPRLRGKPVAVRPAASEYTCAIAASREAKARGIKMGTPIHEARVMCPGLVVVDARHDRYVDVHHRVIAEVGKHIPVTAVCSIDEVACRLMGRERDVENATAIAERVKAGIRANVGECLTSSVGLAPSKMLAKLAADMHKPDGLTVIEGKDLPGKILALPLTDIPGVGRRMAQRLDAAGIRDMQDLWNTAPKQARRIWNSVEGERLWYALHGFDLPEREPNPRHSIGHSHVLSKEMRNLEAARMVARRLLMKCGSRIRRYGEAASALVLHIEYETPRDVSRWDGEGWSQELRFNHTQDSFDLIAKLETLWPQLLRAAPTLRPMSVGVMLHGLKPADKVARDLFADLESDPVERAQNLKLSSALDAINKKFGRDAVSLGVMPGKLPDYVGAKVAFNRIPERAEFLE